MASARIAVRTDMLRPARTPSLEGVCRLALRENLIRELHLEPPRPQGVKQEIQRHHFGEGGGVDFQVWRFVQ